MKKFKSKKHRKIKYKKILICIITLFLLLVSLKTLQKIKIFNLNAVKTLEYTNINKKINIKNEITNTLSYILGININKPTTILKNTMYYKTPNIEKKEYYAIKQQEKNSDILSDPQVYIYNTHQTEQYIGDSTPTVLTASFYLKEKLENLGIKTLVEEANIPEILKTNNWNYAQSYKASRINLEKIKQQYPTIKLFIDLHRDSVNKNLSTVTIDNKDYAKVLFVIGKEHNNYLKNLEFTTSINNIIQKYYPTLTKGILQKEGIGVNGIYNQDLGENIILMEVGANENTIEEVKNTLDLISEILKEKINEN